jgi:hypothetical protein
MAVRSSITQRSALSALCPEEIATFADYGRRMFPLVGPSPSLTDLFLVRVLLFYAAKGKGHYAKTAKRTGAHASRICAALDRVEAILQVELFERKRKRRTARLSQAGLAFAKFLPLTLMSWNRAKVAAREATVVGIASADTSAPSLPKRTASS